MAKSEKEWEQRTLCSDGSCIGIIGADGRCKECGLPYDGEPSSPVADANTEDDFMGGIPADQQKTVETEPVGDASVIISDEPDDAWENRTLCVDESCIGVIGPDGRCKECGKPH